MHLAMDSIACCGMSELLMSFFLRLNRFFVPYIISVRFSGSEVRTTGEAGGLHWPYKGLIQLRLKTHERFANRKVITGCPLPGAANYLPLVTGSPVNGSVNSFMHI